MERYRSGHNGTVLKTVVSLRAPWVRIPLSPPKVINWEYPVNIYLIAYKSDSNRRISALRKQFCELFLDEISESGYCAKHSRRAVSTRAQRAGCRIPLSPPDEFRRALMFCLYIFNLILLKTLSMCGSTQVGDEAPLLRA